MIAVIKLVNLIFHKPDDVFISRKYVYSAAATAIAATN